MKFCRQKLDIFTRLILDFRAQQWYSKHRKPNWYTGVCTSVQVKRETGENPVQGRCCVGVAVAWKSLGEVPEKRSSCVGCQSQKTCLYITHVRLPGTGSVPKQRRSAACWRCSAKRTLILCVRTRRQSVTLPLFYGTHKQDLPVQSVCVRKPGST